MSRKLNSLAGNALDFSFSLASKAILRVVDAGAYSCDRFELFNGTSSMGLTAGGAAGGALSPPWTNFDAAFSPSSLRLNHCTAGRNKI